MGFDEWLEKGALGAEAKAALQYSRIQEKPTSVAFKTPADVTLASQVVRIEMDNVPTAAMSGAGEAATRKLTVFGIMDHVTVADTVMEEGYRFIYDNDEYRIMDVILQTGQKQGSAEHYG